MREGRRLPVYRPGVRMVTLSLRALQWIGFCFACLRSVSVAVIQRGILRMDYGGAMGWVTGAAVCSLAATLSVPVFAKAAYEGWKRAASPRRYFGRLVLCALLSEIPYDFAMSGKPLDWDAQNPLWALLAAAAALEIIKRRTPRPKAPFQALMIFAAFAWALLLRAYMGLPLVLLMALFRFAENRKTICLLGGVLLTLPQFPAPVGMAFVSWYDAEKEDGSVTLFGLLYPMQLAVFALLGILAGQAGF